MSQTPASDLIRLPAVCRKTALKRTQLYELMKRGDFPRAIRLSLRSVAWVSTEVDEWIRNRIAAAQATSAKKGGE
ncbi:MAG: AlpA family transcriptional regulator [Lysobacterales bacterium]|nr:AlpA family phage regulatory protein [Rhodanobacteraceae bacterium]